MVVVGVLALLTAMEYGSEWDAEARLAQLEPTYLAATLQKEMLFGLQRRLVDLNDDAALMTYLHHEWPRTRLIHEILAPIPEDVRLQSFRMEQVEPTGRRPPSRLQSARRKAEEKKLENLSPAARDLYRLREEQKNLATMIWLEGTADDAESLHEYIGLLGDEPLFAEVQLKQSSRADGSEGNNLEFTVEITVRPSYGEVGGPVGDEEPDEQELLETMHRLTVNN